ncbi:hypothetical protein MSAN_00753100 [Mycena sanguinolenta]|uniref:Uncharacterized protein n=1 Tax=Mycena sanguinolenta TaxID=230812 RepID=A0A8H6Z6E3_9AGAR|nr:hypothetical protein MSAN_00753100 [Mycena sanguinolenta]
MYRSGCTSTIPFLATNKQAIGIAAHCCLMVAVLLTTLRQTSRPHERAPPGLYEPTRSPPLSEMTLSAKADIVLGTTIKVVDVVANVVPLTGVPYVGPVLSLASGILVMIQRVRDNSKALQQLGDHVQQLITAVKPVESLSAEMEQNLENLIPVLLEIKEFVLMRMSSRTRFRRALNNVFDESKIKEYRDRIGQELALFGVRAAINWDKKLDKVIRISKRSARGESDVRQRFRSSVSSSSDSADLPWPHRTQPFQLTTQHHNSDIAPVPPEAMSKSDIPTFDLVIPDDVFKHIDDNPSLLAILGVTIVFRNPPSVLQISRVLGMPWTGVQVALETISPYLPGLDSAIDWNSNIELPRSLKDSILQRDQFSTRYYHGLVAKWCLVSQTLDARDIFYSGDFWEFHVCNADLSTDLLTALRSSPQPLDPISRDQLPKVIQWLEKNGGPADLISTYSEASKKSPERVYIMGGMSSFLL